MHRLRQCVCILLLLLVLPLMVGQLFSSKRDAEKHGFAFPYIAGMTCMFAVFELVAVPGIFQHWMLHRVTMIWGAAVVTLAVAGVCKAAYERKASRGLTSRRVLYAGGVQSASRCLCDRIHAFALGLRQPERPRMEHPAGLLAIEMILFQVIFVVLHMHIDDDDTWFVGSAVASFYTDTMYQVNPDTGGLIGFLPAEYSLAPWPIYWAMIGKIADVHPAALMRTILPAFMVPMSYFVSWLIAKLLFHDDEEDAWYFMFFMSVFHTFANFSVRSVSTFLLFRIWQGKAALCSVFVPMAVYAYMRCALKERARDWILLLLTVLAGTMASSTGNILMPFLLFAMAIVTLITKRRLKEPALAMLCLAPCASQVYLYLHVLR